MTLASKIKEVRKKMQLSQEEFAQKLCVSRQAVTKWETGRGVPDIENLQAIARLLGVSVDSLLDEGKPLESKVIQEPIELSKYPKPKWPGLTEDAVVLDKYPDADTIYQVSKQRIKSKKEAFLDFFSPGVFDILEQWRDPAPYYVVEQKEEQYLVQVAPDCMIIQRLVQPYTGKFFTLGNERFTKTLHVLK